MDADMNVNVDVKMTMDEDKNVDIKCIESKKTPQPKKQKKQLYRQWYTKINDNGMPIKDLFVEKKSKKYCTYLYSYGILCSAIVNDEYKIILIKRKHTIGLLEFLRGKYTLGDDNYFIKLLNMMTNSEKQMLKESTNFKQMRENVGLICKNSSHKAEFDDARMKYNILKDRFLVNGDCNDCGANCSSCDADCDTSNKTICLLDEFIDKSTEKWDTQEWELPKGRKSSRESEIKCAVREFCEETGLHYNDIKIAINAKPLDEIYTGINGVTYHHVYYFADFVGDSSKLKFDSSNDILTSEVSEIKWASLTECNQIIRPYHQEKKAVIRKYFQIIESRDRYFSDLDLI